MSRHTVQALFGLLREDLRYGGLPYFGKSQLYEACQCDGQFSEHVQCRDYDMNVYAMQDLRSLGVCYPKVPQAVSFNNSRERQPFQPTRFDHHFHGSSGDVAQDRYSFICKSSLGMIDPRPRLVILQAAGHFGMSVERTTAWIDKITGVMNNQSLKCEGGPVKMHYVFVGATTQIRSMDAKYPHQTREKAAEFNENVRNHLQKLNIPLLDFRPLTADTQTSDGGHHLHEVNLLKSMYLMNFARLVLEQASAEPEVEE